MEASNPYAAPASEVRDIIPPEEALQLAGRLARLGAVILDGLVGAVLIYLPAVLVIGPSNLVALASNANPDPDSFVKAAVVALIGLLVYTAINIYLVIKYRQTIGKRMVGIKVVRKDGSRVSLSRLFWMRNVLVGVVSAIPYLGLVVAIVDMLLIFRASRQCLHDQIADTIVVTA